ncbi:interferon regulatory factor 3-like isoform X2 [Mixophyes fleayi]|uniref:interferon regulatory factor 3-like isoform X2 n=1 Tax=Mixophyes fleayi TaxID=3061075 RepID=UPI003F4E4171
MASQKPRIIPWLIDQIDSQEYPGLIWLNRERTQFRIPWKHGLRQDRSEDDVKIFEAWAIASGSYDPSKHEPSPAVWKRNVRSALNRKNEIKVIRDSSSDSQNPHKIYEIVRGGISAGGDVASEDMSDSVSPSSDRTSLNSPRSQIFVDRNLSQEMTQMQISHNDEDLYLAPEDLQSPSGAPFQDWYSTILSPDVFVEETSPDCLTQPSPCPEEQPGQAEASPSLEQQTLMERMFPNNTFETQFEVNIYYRGTLVKNTLVKNPIGFHITSRRQADPDSYLEFVSLPPANIIPDQKVAAEINKLLQSLEQGTLVEVRHGAICAKRLGKCRSFWSMTDTPTTYEPNPVDKTDYCVLYNFQQFVKELIEFTEQKRTESPQYSIYVCLGELWPDMRSWKKKLIMITPVSMQILHELSYSSGASSLRSSEVNLQISDSLSLRSTSDILTFLREFEERMDCA